MTTITIPYGNFGLHSRTYDVIAEYKEHSLFKDGDYYKIASKKGFILVRNTLNEHLPEVSEESFHDWVDWAMSLPDTMNNLLDRKVDFSGNRPSCSLNECK